ncbi:hypothetical protein WJX74_005778 [Apatococcus lobatus]|uniref:Protein kinase domain-containing protein n=1 Tax=Apatococcus lobatus TaxID=904363 RepID=A0AAW1RVM1_9CHLO
MADAFEEAQGHLLAELDKTVQVKVEEAWRKVIQASGEVLHVQQALAQPLPDAAIASYPGNVCENDRKQHPTSLKSWNSLSSQARARFSGPRRAGHLLPEPLLPFRLKSGDSKEQDEAEVSSGGDLPDMGSMSHPAVPGHPLHFTTELKSPFRLRLTRSRANELVEIWTAVVDNLKAGMTLDAAVSTEAKQRKLSVAVVTNVVHCLGQAFLYCVLASSEEAARGRQQPFLAAEEPGQAPCTSAHEAKEERTQLFEGNEPPADPTHGAQAAGLCLDDDCGFAALPSQPTGEHNLKDLHLGACLARQTFLATLDSQTVVIRMAFVPEHHKSVIAEVSALATLHTLQGTHVPCLLDHGITSKGYAYIITEFIQGHPWRPESAADRALGDQLRAILALFLERGLLHRDIKPENIMVEEGTGRPVFVDFALARQAVDDFDIENEESELEAMLGQAEPDYEVSLAHYQSKMHALQDAFMAREAASTAHALDGSPPAAPPATAEERARQEGKLSAWGSRRALRRTQSRLRPLCPSVLRIPQGPRKYQRLTFDMAGDSDSDDQSLSSHLEVLLGFLEEPLSPAHLFRHRFPSKVGGRPAWLDPVHLPCKQQLTCLASQQPLNFLMQVYAPVEGNAAAFHRAIFLFISPQGNKLGEPGAVRAFRCQLPRANAFYSSNPPSQQDTAPPPVCTNSGEDPWKVRDFEEARATNVTSPGCSPGIHLFLEAELLVEPEDVSDSQAGGSEDEQIAQLLREYDVRRAEEGELTDADLPPELSAEEADADRAAFAAFSAATVSAQSQVLRYCFRPGAAPLWPRSSARPQPEDIKPCPLCQAPRHFECQVMPQLLSELDIDDMDSAAPDWSTIAIYSCSASCTVPDISEHDGSAYLEEFVWVQPP